MLGQSPPSFGKIFFSFQLPEVEIHDVPLLILLQFRGNLTVMTEPCGNSDGDVPLLILLRGYSDIK
jgi:hypothetical protein